MYKLFVEILKTFLSRDEKDTKELAKEISNLVRLRRKFIVFLEGDLGSGKTTFVKFILDGLGIKESEFKGSPTFTIVNEYPSNVYHIDLYRVGFDPLVLDYLERDNGLFFIEWPERLNLKPDLLIRFEIVSDKERKIDVYTS